MYSFKNQDGVYYSDQEPVHGMLNGNGFVVYINNDRYKGDFKNNKRDGYGVMTYSNNRYEGDFKDDKKDGQGILYSNGRRYEGHFKDDEIDGKGAFYYSNGDRFIGQFKHNLFSNGIFYFNNGHKYEGSFENDEFCGKGIYTYDGNQYKGDYKDDKKEGQGVLTFYNGDRYDGEFKDDERNGLGTMTFHNGDRYEGLFKNDEFSGMGVYKFSDGKELIGLWEGGSFVNKQVIHQKHALSPHIFNQKNSPTCWIFAWCRIFMNLIKKYVQFDDTTCPVYDISFIQEFLDNPELELREVECTVKSKIEFVIFCYFYSTIRSHGQNNNQIIIIKSILDSIFNKRESFRFLNQDVTQLKDAIMSNFFNEINPTSSFFIKDLYPNQLTDILDQGLYIYISVNYDLFNNSPEGRQMDQYFIDKIMVRGKEAHAMVIREYVNSHELRQPVFTIINSHGSDRQFFYVPLVFLQNNINEIKLKCISQVIQPPKIPSPTSHCECHAIIKNGPRQNQVCGKPCKKGMYCGLHE